MLLLSLSSWRPPSRQTPHSLPGRPSEDLITWWVFGCHTTVSRNNVTGALGLYAQSAYNCQLLYAIFWPLTPLSILCRLVACFHVSRKDLLCRRWRVFLLRAESMCTWIRCSIARVRWTSNITVLMCRLVKEDVSRTSTTLCWLQKKKKKKKLQLFCFLVVVFYFCPIVDKPHADFQRCLVYWPPWRIKQCGYRRSVGRCWVTGWRCGSLQPRQVQNKRESRFFPHWKCECVHRLFPLLCLLFGDCRLQGRRLFRSCLLQWHHQTPGITSLQYFVLCLALYSLEDSFVVGPQNE